MRILLADDHGLFRDSMSVWLQQIDSDIEIDFAADYTEVETAINSRGYNLVMTDLGMPGMQGTVSIKKIASLLDKTPLLVVSADESSGVIKNCIDAGAAGYVTKSSTGDTILLAVKQVLSGASYIPASARDAGKNEISALTDKQKQLLAYLAEGCSNKVISEKMHLSEGTIKQYVTKLLKQLDVDNRMQAAIKAGALLGINSS